MAPKAPRAMPKPSSTMRWSRTPVAGAVPDAEEMPVPQTVLGEDMNGATRRVAVMPKITGDRAAAEAAIDATVAAGTHAAVLSDVEQLRHSGKAYGIAWASVKKTDGLRGQALADAIAGEEALYDEYLVIAKGLKGASGYGLSAAPGDNIFGAVRELMRCKTMEGGADEMRVHLEDDCYKYGKFGIEKGAVIVASERPEELAAIVEAMPAETRKFWSVVRTQGGEFLRFECKFPGSRVATVYRDLHIEEPVRGVVLCEELGDHDFEEDGLAARITRQLFGRAALPKPVRALDFHGGIVTMNVGLSEREGLEARIKRMVAVCKEEKVIGVQIDGTMYNVIVARDIKQCAKAAKAAGIVISGGKGGNVGVEVGVKLDQLSHALAAAQAETARREAEARTRAEADQAASEARDGGGGEGGAEEREVGDRARRRYARGANAGGSWTAAGGGAWRRLLLVLGLASDMRAVAGRYRRRRSAPRPTV